MDLRLLRRSGEIPPTMPLADNQLESTNAIPVTQHYTHIVDIEVEDAIGSVDVVESIVLI